MRCGISTSCFFPQDTAESLRQVIETGAQVTEIFLNTFSELEDGYLARLAQLRQSAQIQVLSLHPCSSAMEGFFFASRYKTRIRDGMRLYRRFFEACRILGADMLVFHGEHDLGTAGFSDESYAANFIELAKLGREYGVTLCHENVAYCRLNTPARVRQLHPYLGEYAAYVLDIKQAWRKQVQPQAMLDAMAPALRHVHISDHIPGRECLPPGKGEMDYAAFIKSLQATGYQGDMIIELYENNFENAGELARAMQYIQDML